MKLKIDLTNNIVYVNNQPLKFQYKLKPHILKGLSKKITEIIKEFSRNNNFQVRKEVKGTYQWHPKNRKDGYYTFEPVKTIVKSGLWSERPEIISIYNYAIGHNTFVINNPKLEKQIRDYLVQVGAKL